MRLAFLPLTFVAALLASAGLAAPMIRNASFKCQYKPQVNGGWDSRGLVNPFMSGNSLRLAFQSSDNGSGLDEVATTNQDSEFRVEGRCPGFVTLSDNKPFKIRDFTFSVSDAVIGARDGMIELTVAGMAMTGNNEQDSFNKVWSVRKPELDRYNNENDPFKKSRLSPFVGKAENQTVCSTQLTIRFDDLRGVAIRNRTPDTNEREPTIFNLSDLIINLDPC